ncbi:MAG: hypothetical protein Q8L28_01400 [bacterium]|nr:hypothetical protein [bacterium]
MKQGIISDTTKSAKSLAQQIAKQMAQEPLEIIKSVGDQLSNRQEVRPLDKGNLPERDQRKEVNDADVLNDKLKSTRMVEALNREISDIQKQDLFSDLQRRIADGEEVPLEDFAELTFEQRDVLKAQMEAIKVQKENAPVESVSLFGSSKPNRKMGQKQQAQKEQTRVEKPVPPSG